MHVLKYTKASNKMGPLNLYIYKLRLNITGQQKQLQPKYFLLILATRWEFQNEEIILETNENLD